MFTHGLFYHPMPGWKVTNSQGVFGVQRFNPPHKHAGWDITAPDDTPIYSVEDGTCIFSGLSSGLGGYTVKIAHGSYWESAHFHLPADASLRVKFGEKVVAGQQIAVVGHSGNADGPHDHFELRWFGVAQDPGLYLREVTMLPVRLVQQRVGAAVDGMYGPGTAAAVRKFQTDRLHLPVTGSVDMATASALLKEVAWLGS